MKLDKATDIFCTALSDAMGDAIDAGIDQLGILVCLSSAMATSIKSAGGSNKEVAGAFFTFAECYVEDADFVQDDDTESRGLWTVSKQGTNEHQTQSLAE